MIRIGHGYDVHPFEKDRRLILGGVEIPFHLGLGGHSDADVLIHAVIDALLGAASLPDIGQQFPSSDEKYKDISSLELLDKTSKLLAEKQARIVNIDSTVIAQEPVLAPYIPQMRERIGKALGLDKGAVNIKCTTEERLGFTGRMEGIRAHAVCLLEMN